MSDIRAEKTELFELCSVQDCTNKRSCRGYCSKHYRSVRKQQDPEYAARVSAIRKRYHENTGK